VKILGLNPNCFFGIEASKGKGPRSITSRWVSQTSSLRKPERSWRS
jgi:hypothetical protein